MAAAEPAQAEPAQVRAKASPSVTQRPQADPERPDLHKSISGTSLDNCRMTSDNT